MRKKWRWWMYVKFNADRVEKKRIAFFTLTIDAARIPEGVAFAQYLQDSWNRFITAVRVKGVKIKYVAIVEPHRKGGYHLHCLASYAGILSSDVVRGVWYRVGGGCQVHFSELKVVSDEQLRRSIGYITKYMTKDIAKLPRAIKASQGYGVCSGEYKKIVRLVLADKGKGLESAPGKSVVYSLQSGRRLVRRWKFSFLPVEKKRYKMCDVKIGTALYKHYEDVVALWSENAKRKMKKDIDKVG